MPRKNKEELIAFFKTEVGQNKIHTIKNGLESGTIKTFPQIFATVAKTNLQSLLGNEFYSFDKKLEDPGRFTYIETEIMADFFHVEFEVMRDFIRSNQLVSKKKGKRGK